MDWITRLMSVLMWYLHPLQKWFLRKTTRLCELQRICYGETAGAPRTIAVENSLTASRSKEVGVVLAKLKAAGGLTDAEVKQLKDKSVNIVLKVKGIKPDLHKQFVMSLSACFKQMIGYHQLINKVEQLRSEAFDETKTEHETQLLELWRLLQPDRDLDARVSKRWQEIGFQGSDPKTDFRGMGLLGLSNLLYFAREYGVAAQQILSHSHHPKFGYSFAIVGINLTHLAYRLLTDGTLRSHLYNKNQLPDIDPFHQFYSYIFIEFDKFWLECEPRDIMEFNRIRDIFESNLRSQLADTSTCFKVNLQVETV